MAARDLNPPAAPIPCTVIGGFLGAGKTTFLNRVITHHDAPRLAVLVNDFGEILIDESLIAAHDGDTIALSNGCVCCTIGDDLGTALARVLDAETPPERIIIEASGVADPARIADIARVSTELTPGGVLVLADGAAVIDQLRDPWIADTIVAQLQSADLILASKLDTMSPAGVTRIFGYLAEQFPATPAVATTDMDWGGFLAGSCNESDAVSAPGTHARFTTRTLRSQNPISLDKLATWLRGRDDIYRMKGWVFDQPNQCVQLLQAVGRTVCWLETERRIDGGIVAVMVGRPGMPDCAEILDAIRHDYVGVDAGKVAIPAA